MRLVCVAGSRLPFLPAAPLLRPLGPYGQVHHVWRCTQCIERFASVGATLPNTSELAAFSLIPSCPLCPSGDPALYAHSLGCQSRCLRNRG